MKKDNILKEKLKIRCQRCGNLGAKRRRTNTNYMDDGKNFVVECNNCFTLTEEYWEEQWEIYQSLRG
ncbi:Zn finger protein [Bacillus phage AR9]|uniref:Zn finger protein n=1 Tax=Bacillus phage AR9 TaxID=1815509 RepID=A0A172JHX0_BPPB1|nr:Zn finger protein [Bacillus phage AR9]AMS01147.1 Zn finger protein [Bacillus phage AR9]